MVDPGGRVVWNGDYYDNLNSLHTCTNLKVDNWNEWTWSGEKYVGPARLPDYYVSHQTGCANKRVYGAQWLVGTRSPYGYNERFVKLVRCSGCGASSNSGNWLNLSEGVCTSCKGSGMR